MYYGHLIATVNESIVAPRLYPIIMMTSIGLTVVEYALFSNMEDMFAYNMVQDTMDSWHFRIEITAVIAIILVQVMLIVSQSRIEYDTYRLGDHLDSGFVIKLKNWLLKSNEVNPEGLDKSTSYNVSATRLVFIIGSIWVLVGLALPIYQVGNEKLFFVLAALISEVLLPCAFIWTHKNMKNYVIQRIKQTV